MHDQRYYHASTRSRLLNTCLCLSVIDLDGSRDALPYVKPYQMMLVKRYSPVFKLEPVQFNDSYYLKYSGKIRKLISILRALRTIACPWICHEQFFESSTRQRLLFIYFLTTPLILKQRGAACRLKSLHG